VFLPAMLLGGLVLIPIGLLIYRRQLARRVAALTDKPMRLVRAIVILTFVNFTALGTAGYGGVHYMSSTTFCGTACHSVMGPEYDVYQSYSHAKIGCVACHVGPGATAYIAAKLNGAKQLVETVLDDYSRPIPTPVHNLPPVVEMCGKCHDPRRYLGTKLVVKPHYEPNEKNSGFINVLLMRRGGQAPDGVVTGIHWHAHPDTKVEFAASERNTEIPWVRVTDKDGKQRVFQTEDYAGGTPDKPRRMDCSDCHNRVGHPFDELGDGIDRAIASGLVSRKLPFVRKHAEEALKPSWSREGAGNEIRSAMESAYAKMSLDAEGKQLLDGAITELTKLWLRNNYPERKLGWGAYPSFKAHFGCFRCHDGKHRDRTGAVISKECETCHVVLSEKQEDPEILGTLGIRSK